MYTFKVAFVQAAGRQQHGTMILSAVLKEHGFDTAVFAAELEGDGLVEVVTDYQPNILAASMMTAGSQKDIRLLKTLKENSPQAFVIAGGPHPTFYPDMINQGQFIDAICIGEGEYALLELATSLREGKINPEIQNLWFRIDGKVYKNRERPLIEDLDTLPFPDRSIYFDKYTDMAKGDVKFNVGRGCPFDCSYCFNKGMKDLYKGEKWTRSKSVERIIAEIKDVNSRYPIKWLNFNDDTFNVRKKWLKTLLEAYKKEINIPFMCQLRIDFTDEEMIDNLKDAGVEKITVGIEHGNEKIRKNLLRRNITDDQILQFGAWINKRKIRLHTTNIVGFPEETMAQAYSTIKLNSIIKPELAVINLLNPYPGTDIYRNLKENGYLVEGFSFNKLTGQNVWAEDVDSVKSLVKNDNIPLFLNLRCFFMILIKCYWLKPFVDTLIKLPNNYIFEFIGRITSYFHVEIRYATSWAERFRLVKRLF